MVKSSKFVWRKKIAWAQVFLHFGTKKKQKKSELKSIGAVKTMYQINSE